MIDEMVVILTLVENMLKYTSLTARIVIIHAHVKGSPDNSWRSMNTDGEGKPPGGFFRNFGVGMCRWDPGTRTRASSAEFCYPILDQSSCFPSLDKIFNQLISFLKNDTLF